jgi:hypothetical protein
MEVSPRGGGNRLAEVIRYDTGLDMITACVRAAVGDEIEEIQTSSCNGHWAEIILHAEKKGKFRGLVISEDMIPFVYEKDLWVAKGDLVEAFSGANNAIGTLVLNFDTAEKKEKALSELSWIKIDVEEYDLSSIYQVVFKAET